MFSSVSALGTSNEAVGWISCSLLKSAIWVGSIVKFEASLAHLRHEVA
jgi:hypothetical protein